MNTCSYTITSTSGVLLASPPSQESEHQSKESRSNKSISSLLFMELHWITAGPPKTHCEVEQN